MPTKLNLTKIKGSLLGWLRRKGQTLKGAVPACLPAGMAAGPLDHRVEGGSVLNVLVKRLSFFKKYLPIIIIILVLIIGLAIGRRIASLSDNKINIPKPADLPNTITRPSDSSLTPLVQSVRQFSAQLPDPLMPEFSDSILLQELED